MDDSSHPFLTRRDILKAMGLTAFGAASLPGEAPAAADGDAANPRIVLIPEDKQLDPNWVAGLYARGAPTVYRGWDQVKYIGMPVGGIGCGNLYLGGDGKLWLWDIFNEHHEGCIPKTVQFRSDTLRARDGANYVDPPAQESPWNVEQGFAVSVSRPGQADAWRSLDRHGFSRVSFEGHYPIGEVRYSDPASPLEVRLQAFSPFVPLAAARSSFPATVMRYTLKNCGDAQIEATLTGWLENPGLREHPDRNAQRVNRTGRDDRMVWAQGYVQPGRSPEPTGRPDILFDEFERSSWGTWTEEGQAFAGGPFGMDQLAPYQRVEQPQGDRFVNSHNTRAVGPDSGAADALTGTLSSRTFAIERAYINVRVAGGNQARDAFLEVVVDGESVGKATGRNSNRFRHVSLNVSQYQGREARIRIVDRATGGWGIIEVDEIVFSDHPVIDVPLDELPDHGSVALAILGEGGATASGAGDRPWGDVVHRASGPLDQQLVGGVHRTVTLAPGESADITALVGWHYPNLRVPGLPAGKTRRGYAGRFADAVAVLQAIADDFDALAAATVLWRDTWQDSTLPHWLLDRTLTNISTLATNTCFVFEDGRPWFWEGIGCCPGTCTHVWNYAQAIARLFPEIERALRTRVDYGIAYTPSGEIHYRAENAGHGATDGQLGTILRFWREHTMSADATLLQAHYARVKQSLIWVMDQDRDQDGILEGAQYNTLDQTWYGPMAWVSSMYIAALEAGVEMAREMGDGDFAEQCLTRVDRGRAELAHSLFNGEYFIHRPDPAHPEATNTNDGCHIDQLFGESLARQYGLPSLVDPEQARRALASLWRYNFAPEVGPYRDAMQAVIPKGRWYAMPEESGLIMCTWPTGGAELAPGNGGVGWAVAYFNECMSGFEYQVAAHMLYEGSPEMVEHGLAITRAIHDRYHATKRNPYNEIECSDHYGRAMAGYGVFLGACGYQYHGPQGALGFAPRIAPENFKAAFTAAEGWGSFQQRYVGATGFDAGIEMKFGSLRLKRLSLHVPPARQGEVTAHRGAAAVAARAAFDGGTLRVTFSEPLDLTAGHSLRIHISG